MALQNTQFITLRSVDRKSGTDGDCIFSIPTRNLPKQHSFFLHNVSIPVTWYNIDAPNNVFYFRETGAITATASFTIPPGNYTSLELAQLLETEMTANSPNTNTYTVTYDFVTGKMTFATGSADTVEFEENEMSLGLFLRIGFFTTVLGTGYVKDGATVGTTITSPSYCIATPTNLIMESSLRTTGYSTQFQDLNTFATIPMSASPGDILVYEPPVRVELFSENDPGQLANINVRIRRDDTGEILGSLNGPAWTMTIGVRGHSQF